MVKAIYAINQLGWFGKEEIAEAGKSSLLWSCPQDLAHFREATAGQTVIMGSGTFRSLGMPLGLPGRLNIVISSNPDLAHELGIGPDIQIYNNPLEAIQDHPDCWIIGGQILLESTRDYIDEIYMSRINDLTTGDIWAPNMGLGSSFILQSTKEYKPTAECCGFRLEVYKRIVEDNV